jgi:putative membrane protein
MKRYDRKNWLRLVLAVRGTVLKKVLPRVALVFLLAAVLRILREQLDLPQLDSLGHSLVGLSLGLLVVFRHNTAYERYWEGRRAWGIIVSASRNVVRVGATYMRSRVDLADLVIAFAYALSDRLHRIYEMNENVREWLTPSQAAALSGADNMPVGIALQISQLFRASMEAGEITPLQVGVMEGQVALMIENQGTCERVQNTPIPLSHAALINQLLFVYLVTLPFVLVPRDGWGGVLMTVIVAFGLLGIEAAGVEVENPFGRDDNDLPLDDYCRIIEQDCHALARAA